MTTITLLIGRRPVEKVYLFEEFSGGSVLRSVDEVSEKKPAVTRASQPAGKKEVKNKCNIV